MKPTLILYDSAFEKRWNKFVKGLTVKQKEQIRERLEIFKEDIFDKRLKTHRLKGNLKAYYAFSVSYSDRIVFKILDDNTIYFIEIGSHDICY
ncbi:MAG: type II toxin-antitoxin system mRNA interferase toxin, RelE/StbE family [Pseudomonadota bacterium]